MNAIHRRRLLKLADFLEALPPKRFNYCHWVGDDWEGAANLSCGTTACALGWATTMPIFRRLGLCLYKPGRYYTPTVILKIGKRRGSTFDATEEIFGLDHNETMELFTPRGSGELGPKAKASDVAAHIRRFVERRSP